MSDPIKYTAPTKYWEITAGDDVVFTSRIKLDGVVQTLNDWEINIQVRDKKTGDQIGDTLSIGNGIELVSPPGDALITIPSSITESLRTTKCIVFDIETINPTGKKRTFLKVEMIGQNDVTKL